MELKLRALIIDDEERARKLLNKLLEETLCFNNIKMADSSDSAYEELKNFKPDVIFLDIKMPGKDGFDFIKEHPPGLKKTEIVFVTAYDQYAIQAIKKNAFDYLLKPVNRIELKECIVKLLEKKNHNVIPDNQEKITESQKKANRIRINCRTGTIFINPAHILYCEADGNYTTIYTGEKQCICSMNLGKVEEMLPINGFVRVGRSHIFNSEYITLLDRKKSQVTLVRENKSVTVKIPRQHLKDLDHL